MLKISNHKMLNELVLQINSWRMQKIYQMLQKLNNQMKYKNLSKAILRIPLLRLLKIVIYNNKLMLSAICKIILQLANQVKKKRKNMINKNHLDNNTLKHQIHNHQDLFLEPKEKSVKHQTMKAPTNTINHQCQEGYHAIIILNQLIYNNLQM